MRNPATNGGVVRHAVLWALMGGGVLVAVAFGLVGRVKGPDLQNASTTSVARELDKAPARKPATGNSIDELVLSQLNNLRLQPAEICSDGVFMRRAYLDVIGTLPTAKEARAFIGSKAADKRTALIDDLLKREEFADYWAMKWGDLLRIKAEFPINLWPNAAQAYHRWVRSSIVENKPYDQFARELLTSSGSNFRVGPANFYRAMQNRTPEGIAATVALTFMGCRAEEWPTNQLAGTAVFFSQVGYKPSREWKEEIVFWDPLGRGASNAAPQYASIAPSGSASKLSAIFPDGTQVQLPPGRDPREVFADWLIKPENPWFTRNIANRVWCWLMGRGVIHEADDIRDNNPPSNPELLAFLEHAVIDSHYDLKKFYRLILTSKAYQFSCEPKSDGPLAEANFASYPVRRLGAEVLIDAINKVTGTWDLYTSAIPEPFTYIPANTPAINLADGSITSPFLALFGRSARATGIEDERDDDVLPAQWLHLLNSSHVQQKLDGSPNLRPLFAQQKKDAEIVEELYLTVLSRFPTPEEVQLVEDYHVPSSGKTGGNAKGKSGRSREEWADITWALINSTEFVFKH